MSTVSNAIKTSASSIRPTGTPSQYLVPTPAITPTIKKPGSGGGTAPKPATTPTVPAGSTSPPVVYNNVTYPYGTPAPVVKKDTAPPPSNDTTPPPAGDGYRDDWRDKALREGKDVNSPEFSRMREIEKEISDRNNALAAAQEEAQIQGAERTYGAEMDLLRNQKGEVGTVASTQRNRLQEQKGLIKEDYEATKAKDIRDIEKQKTEGQEQKKGDEETLGRAWRDMTMQVQANMRARGIQDSQYAFSAEGDITKDFNSGLRNLQTSYTKVFDNLSQAVVDVNDTFSRESKKLDSEVASQTESIDAWERGQIIQIQGQEKMSLARKLNAIQDATVKAQALRAQTQNAIDQQKLALETWLYQFNVQTKAAIEQAAYKQNVASAAETLSNIAKIASTTIAQANARMTVYDPATGTNKTLIGGFPVTQEAVDYANDKAELVNQTINGKVNNNAVGSLLTPNVFGSIGNTDLLDY
jgi:hypothetical protein